MEKSWCQVLCLYLQMLNQHAFNPSSTEIPVANTEIANLQIASIIRVTVIVLVEIPGLGITPGPQSICSNLAGTGRSNGIYFQGKITAAIYIKKYRLQAVANRQLQRKIRHGNSGTTSCSVLRTGIDVHFG